MRFSAKSFIFSLFFVSGIFAHATEPICQPVAIAALAKTLQIPVSQISYLGGASIGDGGFAYQIFILSAASDRVGGSVAYEVRFSSDSADTCDQTLSDAKIEKVSGD
jgi:hypothetical protein